MKPTGASWGSLKQNSTLAWNNSTTSGMTTIRSKSTSCCPSSTSPTKMPPLRQCSRPLSASRCPPGCASESRLSKLGGGLVCLASRPDAPEVAHRRAPRASSDTITKKHLGSQLDEMGLLPGSIRRAAPKVSSSQLIVDRPLQDKLSSQPPSISSDVMQNVLPITSLSGSQLTSREFTVVEELEQIGIAPLAAAATLARLGPRASLTDALSSLCHEPNQPLDEPGDSWECPICFQQQKTRGWHCPDGHRFCATCMRHHAKAVAFPRCPQPKCGFDLDVTDLTLLKVSRKRIDVFEQNRLENAIQALGSDTKGDNMTEKVMHCTRDTCSNVVLVPIGAACRQPFACPCGAPSVCTRCGDSPYHFHGDCSQVPALRRRWLEWVSRAQERRKKHAEALDALQKKLDRDVECRNDEIWKARNCRLCPNCNRVVEKLEGCDSMKCGQDCHGGNKQAGCGFTFTWSEAEPYSAVLQSKRQQGFKMTPEEASTGKGVFHPGIDCGICNQAILGPRLRCIHCENFEVCLDCEEHLDSHDLSHVFELFYKSDFDWSSVHLPRGWPVRVVRHGGTLPPRWYGNQFEGKVATIIELVGDVQPASKNEFQSAKKAYKVSIPGHKGSHPQLPAEHLLPLFKTREQAKSLLEGRPCSWSGPSAPSFDVKTYSHLLATEGVIVACRYLNHPGAFGAARETNLGGWR